MAPINTLASFAAFNARLSVHSPVRRRDKGWKGGIIHARRDFYHAQSAAIMIVRRRIKLSANRCVQLRAINAAR
jgi:hypothetical protein